MSDSIVVSTFYKFFDNPRYQDIRLSMKEYAQSLGVTGIIIMGLISGSIHCALVF